MPFFVYNLTDPRNGPDPKSGENVYVGISTNPARHFIQHTSGSDANDEKVRWIRQLSKEMLLPSMRIRDIPETESAARAREAFWIHLYQSQGAYVLNIQNRQSSDSDTFVMREQQQIDDDPVIQEFLNSIDFGPGPIF